MQSKVISWSVFILLAGLLHAQQPTSSHPGLDAYRNSRIGVYMNDFGELSRYREANAQLGAPAPHEKRVVFFGDSITDGWKLDEYFPGRHYVNRGISGQTTSEMLVRFREDVIDLRPKVVVVLAGTNDIAGNTGPISLEDIEANFASMADLCKANGIQMVISSILPVHNYTGKAQEFYTTRPMESIRRLNDWLKQYAAKNHLVFLDYYSKLIDDKGLLRRDLADDGLHPNAAGYKIMAPLAEQAITTALKKK